MYMKINNMWFKVNENIEYSTDYIFFIGNQISVSGANTNKITFNSRLESMCFEVVRNPFGLFTDKNIDEKIKEIHNKILNNHYHKNGKIIE